MTRARHQAAELGELLTAQGAQVEFLPLIEIELRSGPEADAAVADLPGFRLVAFTSANAVDTFLDRLPKPAPLPPAAVVGPATAAALRRHGVEPVVEAERRDGAGLAKAIVEWLQAEDTTAKPQGEILVPQADDARRELVAALRDAGFPVRAPVTYGKRLPSDATERARDLFGDGPWGWVTLTSPRIVEHFVELASSLGVWREGLLAASIGPTTSQALRRHGIEPAAEATPPAADALVEAIVAAGLSPGDRRSHPRR